MGRDNIQASLIKGARKKVKKRENFRNSVKNEGAKYPENTSQQKMRLSIFFDLDRVRCWDGPWTVGKLPYYFGYFFETSKIMLDNILVLK